MILTDCRIFAGGTHLSGQSNKIELPGELEERDVTNFLSAGWKECTGALPSFSIEASGQWVAGSNSVDESRWSALGTNEPWTICPLTDTAGVLAYLGQANESKYQTFDVVGSVMPWAASAQGSWPLVRGKSLHSYVTPRTATGSGTAVQLIATPTGQNLYAALHVLSVSGTATPTLTVRVQSDNASDFPSATTVITFTAATAVGGQITRVAGPITDDWLRADWTISGTNPSFLFVVSVGVGP